MPREESGAPDYGIAAVERTTALLLALARLGPSTLTSLAAEVGCTPAAAFRILRTLQGQGLARQAAKRGPWQLGARWLAVGRAATRQGAAQAATAPMMAAMAHAFGETVILAQREGEQSVVMAVQPGRPGARQIAAVGDREPLHAGPGRLLLAYAPAPVLRAVLASRLPRLASATRIDAPFIIADLPRIRARGWLITTHDVADGVVTVSVPVQDGAGEVVAVLSLASTVARMRQAQPLTLLVPLLEAAAAIGKLI